MGNYRFKLSDMIPNAWFFKLRDMGMRRTRKQTSTPSKKKKQSSSPSSSTTQQQHYSSKPKQPHQCNPRKSYYFTRELEPTSIKLYTSSSNTPKLFSPDPPTKSSKQRTKKTTTTTTRTHSPKKLVNSSVSSGCNCRTTLESVWAKPYSLPPDQYYYSSSSQFDSSTESEFPDPEIRTDRVLLPIESSFDEMVSFSSNSCSCSRLNSNDNNKNTNNNDIIIDVDKNSLGKRKDDKLDEMYDCDSFSELELPPIITKTKTKAVMSDDEKKKEMKTRSRKGEYEENHSMKGSMKVKIMKEDTSSSIKEQRNSPVRGFCVSSPKVKVRVNSPRISRGGRKSVSNSGSRNRRSLSDSFAIVKSSFNPQKDFRESMVEMIVENNLRASKDLEDLLACYLSLNSDEYHDLIIKVFKQIWFDLTETR